MSNLLRSRDHRDAASARIVRMGVVERVHVGEQDQGVRVDHVGHQRGQPVVIAEPDLVGGDRVVFVHDRHDF